MNRLRKALISGLGMGYMPIAPGTWGSAAVCGIFMLLARATDGHPTCMNVSMIALAVAASAVCVALGSFAEETYGKRDPSQCTVDEWAGQAVALLLLPLGGQVRGLLTAVGAAFLTFRLFDIVKPPPARRLEKLPGGWGILMDDVIAGVYANVVCQLLLRVGLG